MTVSNPFANPTFPIYRHEAVDISSTDHTPSFPATCIFVGTAGDVVLEDEKGTQATWSNVPAGTLIPFLVAKVIRTSTTASNMVVGGMRP